MTFLLRRVARLLVRPHAEWAVIDGEPDEVAAICQSYVGVLGLVPAVAPLAGVLLVAGRFIGAAGMSTAILAAITTWILVLAGAIVSAVVIEKVAALFDADGDLTQAMKLVAYASTPFWLSHVSRVFASSTPLLAIGLAWSAWLLWLGAPVVMHTPLERRLALAAASAGICVLSAVGLRAVFAAFRIPYMGY